MSVYVLNCDLPEKNTEECKVQERKAAFRLHLSKDGTGISGRFRIRRKYRNSEESPQNTQEDEAVHMRNTRNTKETAGCAGRNIRGDTGQNETGCHILYMEVQKMSRI